MEVAKKLETAQDYVDALRIAGGNISNFCRKNCPTTFHHSWLFQVYETLKMSPQLDKEWQLIISISQKCRLDYLQSTAIDYLADFDDVTEGKSAAEANSKINFCKTILIDVLASRVEGAKRRASFPYLKYLKETGDPEADEPADPTQSMDQYVDSLAS